MSASSIKMDATRAPQPSSYTLAHGVDVPPSPLQYELESEIPMHWKVAYGNWFELLPWDQQGFPKKKLDLDPLLLPGQPMIAQQPALARHQSLHPGLSKLYKYRKQTSVCYKLRSPRYFVTVAYNKLRWVYRLETVKKAQLVQPWWDGPQSNPTKKTCKYKVTIHRVQPLEVGRNEEAWILVSI